MEKAFAKDCKDYVNPLYIIISVLAALIALTCESSYKTPPTLTSKYQQRNKNYNATHLIHSFPKAVELSLQSCLFGAKMAEHSSNSGGFLSNIVYEILGSPLNIALVIVIAILIYKIVKSRQLVPSPQPEEPPLPKLKKRDFTVEELKKYDGNGEDGRVLVAVNGNVYDVTKGKRFYGPGKCIIFIVVSC